MPAGFPNTKSAQYAALRAVIDPDTYAHYRKICRWFSRTFATPLMQVYDLPSDFVMQHYLEEQYEALTHDERRNMLIELTETPEQRIERLRKEAQEDHKSYTESKATLDQVMSKIAKMNGSDIKQGLEAYRAALAEKKSLKEGAEAEKKSGPSQADVIAALMNAKPRPVSDEVLLPDEPVEELPKMAPPPKAAPPVEYPDFEMKFTDEELNGLDLDADSISLPKK